MNLFFENDYREILKNLVEEKKALNPKHNFEWLSKKTGVPKSYLSKVIHRQAHFNNDQLFLICDTLELNEEKVQYLQLLLEFERSIVKKRKEVILKEIKRFQQKAMATKENIKAGKIALDPEKHSEYFLNPLNQLIHMALSIPRYQQNLPQLAKDLGYPLKEILAVIQKLEAMEFVVKKGEHFENLVPKIHLPHDHSLYKLWRTQIKLMSLERLNRFSQPHDYSFGVTFSATKETKNKIHAAFLEFLKNVEPLVEKSESAEVYQFNFDLFSWTSSDF